MKLKILGSNSKGCCYIIEGASSRLILDAGAGIRDLKKYLGFNMDVAGCLVTHEHKDHIDGIKGILKNAINVYASRGTIESIGVESDYTNIIESQGIGQILQLIHT